MGLDSLELVVAFEERFDLRIPDEIAEKLVTPGHVHEYIVEVLSERRHAKVPEIEKEHIWAQIVEIVVKQLGVKPELVTRTARFVDDLGVD